MSDADDNKPLTPAERDLLAKLSARANREERERNPPPYRHITEGFDLGKFKIPTLTEAQLQDRQDQQDSIAISCPIHQARHYEPCLHKQGAPVNCADRVRRWKERKSMREEERKHKERLVLADKLRRAGVPEKHLRMVETGQWKNWRSWRIAQAFYASSYQGLVLAGDTGRGKSGAAAYIASLGPRRRPGRVVWVRASTLGSIDLYPRSEKRDEEDEEQPRRRRLTWEDIVEAQLTIVDDLGTGQLVPEIRFSDRLTDLLAAKFDNDREVVMTHNGTRAEFQKIVPRQIWDRIEKWCMWEETGGDSYREEERQNAEADNGTPESDN